MQFSWRRNPKTPEGWPKRVAIALLAALAVFAVSLPVTFIVSINHLERVGPGDPQIFLGALTSAVAIGLFLFGLIFVAVLSILYLFSLRGRRASR
jgi:protein-S-isoprenylcysteine O-methyltransferase Ste14